MIDRYAVQDTKSRNRFIAKLLGAMAIVVILVLAFGCSERSAPPISESGVNKEGWTLAITTHMYPDDESVTAARNAYLKDLGQPPVDDQVQGWSVWTATSPACEIHAVPPRSFADSKRIWVLGHELAHCLYGKFHK